VLYSDIIHDTLKFMSQQQEENEAISHRFHMNIFQEGKLAVGRRNYCF
jgi:hypothetical protein